MLTNTMRTRLWQGSLAQPFSVHKNIGALRADGASRFGKDNR